MQLKIDARDLEKLIKGLERMQKQIPAGIARGLNEGGDKVRTKVQRSLQKQTSLIRYASVTAHTRTLRSFAGAGGASPYEIRVSGKPTKMFEFKTQVTKGSGGGMTAILWNNPHRFKRSFEGSGSIAGQLRMRTTGPRHPTRSFDGPNLAKEAVKDQSAEAFFSTAEAEVPNAVLKHLLKSLG